MSDAHESRVRLDKWLWAARFFKTRSLAAQAVDGGRVRVNEQRVKPAKQLSVGDRLLIHAGELEWIIQVRALSGERRGAPEARQLYQESEASMTKRLQAIAARKASALHLEGGRPTKKNRRMIHRFTGG